MTNTTRIALAGFGAWGQMHARAIAAIEGAEVVSVYCHGEESTRMAAEMLPTTRRFSDFGVMLASEGYDVVDIAVPNFLHASFACAALRAGANVFLEKPLGLSLAECDDVIEAARRNGGLVALNHELRVSKQWGAVRGIVASGEVGPVRYQHLSLFRHKFRTGSGGWRYNPAKVGSWILEELVHFFDLVMWYATERGRPARVRALGNGGEAGMVQNFAATLEWADGSVAVLTQCLSGFEHHILLELAGEDGAIRTWWSGARDRTLHPDFDLRVRRKDSEPQTLSVPRSGEVFELEENLRTAFEGFRAGRSILPPEEARLAIEVCLAAEEAYRTGDAVDLAAS